MSSKQFSLIGEPTEIIDPDVIARGFLEQTRGIGSPTVTSLSGGRTSAWMAINYPTDYYVFALVRTDHPSHIPSDPGLVRDVREKCPVFTGSLELPDTLRCVLELEQKLGKQIDWVWADLTFEQLVSRKNYLPNSATRFCTQFLKYVPIFDWSLSLLPSQIVEMNLGFRADEPNRVYKMIGGKRIKGKGWDFSGLGTCEDHPKNRKKIEWRFRQAPLYLDGIKKYHIHSDPWILSKPFPEISNCSHCFFHTPIEHRKQHIKHPECASFWTDLESSTGNTFVNGVSLNEILQGSANPLFDFEDSSCSCTD